MTFVVLLYQVKMSEIAGPYYNYGRITSQLSSIYRGKQGKVGIQVLSRGPLGRGEGILAMSLAKFP